MSPRITPVKPNPSLVPLSTDCERVLCEVRVHRLCLWRTRREQKVRKRCQKWILNIYFARFVYIWTSGRQLDIMSQVCFFFRSLSWPTACHYSISIPLYEAEQRGMPGKAQKDGPLSPKGTDGPLSPKGTVFLAIHFFRMIPCHSKSSRQERFLKDLDHPIETEWLGVQEGTSSFLQTCSESLHLGHYCFLNQCFPRIA